MLPWLVVVWMHEQVRAQTSERICVHGIGVPISTSGRAVGHMLGCCASALDFAPDVAPRADEQAHAIFFFVAAAA